MNIVYPDDTEVESTAYYYGDLVQDYGLWWHLWAWLAGGEFRCVDVKEWWNLRMRP
ncbi:hypothetical protein LCGC14_1064050 [marine sediment metagenome]|uniref:Uncharacterized protein n=1 Tax=marine sediment metagenome TaxID=412755 RepID=A0A0F9N756_9ZZZZ